MGSRPGSRCRVSRARPRFWVPLLIPILLFSATAGSAGAVAMYRCWTIVSEIEPVLRCRVGGVDLIDFADPGAVEVTLFAAVGVDLWGECWFDREVWSGWTAYGEWTAESAILVFGADGTPETGRVAARTIRRCRTDPAITPIERGVWARIRSHDFAGPDPSLVPTRGVVGVPTFLDLVVPAPGSYVVGNPDFNEALFIEVGVAAVRVDWGDGAVSLVAAPMSFGGMTGYPSGSVRHLYGRSALWRVEVEFEWRARWRSSWDPMWRPLALGATAQAGFYAIDEIVSRVVR